jgi:CBS-domain-containing membrane protein
MSSPVITVTADTVVEDCCRTMEQHQDRRVPVADEAGDCCDVVSQADIARRPRKTLVGEVLKDMSRPMSTPSRIG